MAMLLRLMRMKTALRIASSLCSWGCTTGSQRVIDSQHERRDAIRRDS
jgi:hypothetical protein